MPRTTRVLIDSAVFLAASALMIAVVVLLCLYLPLPR